jgi:uncharacterized protein (TIGR03437 family)
MTRFVRAVLFLTLFLTWITAWSAAAQTWDNTGNNLLNGTYYFRNVSYHVADSAGDLDYAAALYGTINFDGNGNYTMNAPWLVDSGGNNQASSNVTGTYTIAASGFGFLDNPLGDSVYGLVSNGIFVGSSTESGNNDLFIAVTTASKATSATLVGNYSIAYMNVLDGSPGNTYDALGQFTADGRGNIGTATFTAYLGASGSTAIPITEPGVRYIFSNGAGNISFPTSGNPAVRGTQFLYISPDGNFVFGGSNSNWDFFVGVRKGTAASFGGTYYQAGLSEDASALATAGYAIIGSYYGSLIATGGSIIAHQRFEDVYGPGTQDDTYGDSYPTTAAGQYTDFSTQYILSQDGAIRIGFGVGPSLGIDVAVRAPNFSGTGVYLNPTMIQNADSFAPFTASLARGELVYMQDSGLTDQIIFADQNKSFPFTLGGVKVLVNGVPAAISQVTPSYIVFQVPYETTAAIAQIQVVNNQGASNTITAFMGSSAPGVPVFNGYGIAQHSDYSLVTASNPARPGDVLLVYMTGLGDVTPAIADGAVGPIPASTTTNTFAAYIGGVAATVAITEVVPTIAGDYVMALTVPSGIPAGDQILSISGPDSFTATALLPVAAAAANLPAQSAQARPPTAATVRQISTRSVEVAQKSFQTPGFRRVRP